MGLGLIRRCRHGAPEAEARGGQNRTVTLRGCKAGRFMRALASSLMLHATFPLDALAQTAPSSTAAVPAIPAVTAQPGRAARRLAAFDEGNRTLSSAGDPHARRDQYVRSRPTAGPRSAASLGLLSRAYRWHLGPLTRAAIRRFQHEIDAASTGYLTEKEANRLVGTPAAVAQPALASRSTRNSSTRWWPRSRSTPTTC